MIVVPLLRNSE